MRSLLNEVNIRAKFLKFKDFHNVYQSEAEENNKRFQIFRSKVYAIETHNVKSDVSFKKGIKVDHSIFSHLIFERKWVIRNLLQSFTILIFGLIRIFWFSCNPFIIAQISSFFNVSYFRHQSVFWPDKRWVQLSTDCQTLQQIQAPIWGQVAYCRCLSFLKRLTGKIKAINIKKVKFLSVIGLIFLSWKLLAHQKQLGWLVSVFLQSGKFGWLFSPPSKSFKYS